MNLVINNLSKAVLLSLTLAASSISCVSAKPLTEVSKVPITPITVQKNQSNLEKTQNVKLEFNTIYDSEEKCDQKNFGFTWQELEDDLNYYGMGMNKVRWLMSPYLCIQVKTPKYNNVIIYELYDKNNPLNLFYIHETNGDKRILATVTRNSQQKNISEGERKYFGDSDTFMNGKFILDQYINQQNY